MMLWVFIALASMVSGQFGGPKWNNPMHIEDFDVNVCLSAPQAWRMGAKHCATADVKIHNSAHYTRAQTEAAALGFTGITDTWMNANTCTAYTRGGNSCNYYCAQRGTVCLAASMAYGQTHQGTSTLAMGINQCAEQPKGSSYRSCDLINPKTKYTCTCGPFVPDCLYHKSMGESCSSAGDPHIAPFTQFTDVNPTIVSLGLGQPKMTSFMQIGTYRFFNGVYRDVEQLEVQVRMVEHPTRSDVSVNQAFVMTGELLCGNTISITGKPADFTYYAGKGYTQWPDHDPIFLFNGVQLAGGNVRNDLVTNLIASLSSCANICEITFKPNRNTDDRVRIVFNEGSSLSFDSWYHAKHGLSVNVFMAINVLQPSATYYVEDKVPAMGAGSPAGLNPGGLCYGDYQSDLSCTEQIFPAASYLNGETCADHLPDPNRPSVLTDIIKDCKKNQKKLYKQAFALCDTHCPTKNEVHSCLFDACIAQSLDGLEDMAVQCDFADELKQITNPLPTPKPTRACNPLVGIKFKWNRNKLKDLGIRPTPDELFTRDIWDLVTLHNHGSRHQQKKFYNNEIAGMSDAQVACLCHQYCYSVGTHWYQSNLKRRKNGNRYGKCQCYNGEPVFKKARPTYSTGYVSEWAYNWYSGLGGGTGNMATSRANDMLGKGVTFDVPETSKLESQSAPHPGVRVNDRQKKGFHIKANRLANKVKSARFHKKPQMQYQQLGPKVPAPNANQQG